jgi:hypothetical protein
MNEATVVRLAPGGDRSRLRLMLAQPMTNFALQVLGTEDECAWVLDRLGNGPQAVGELLAEQRAERRQTLLRTMGWLAKTDLIRVEGLEVAADGDIPAEIRAESAAIDAPRELVGAVSGTRAKVAADTAVTHGDGNGAAHASNRNGDDLRWWQRLRRKPR